MISQDLLAKEGFYTSSFHLPELIRYLAGSPGAGGMEILFLGLPSNFLCLSLGTWSIEASYQSAAQQKFKAAFDVKEYGEQGVTGRARWVMHGTGLEMESTYCVPGSKLSPGEQDHMFQPLGVA